MKKRFWNRLVAAVVTMAMAFSILAMPALAAGNTWAGGDTVLIQGEKCIVWVTETYLRGIIADETGLSGEALENALKAGKDNLILQGYAIYEGDIPDNAYVGLSKAENSTKFWYTAGNSLLLILAGDITSVDWNTGKVTLNDGTTVSALNAGTTGGSGNTGGNASVSAGSDGSAAAILALGGAAVAAVTGVYLYTHPEIVQDIKDAYHNFVDNVQEKFQSLFPARDVEEAPAA